MTERTPAKKIQATKKTVAVKAPLKRAPTKHSAPVVAKPLTAKKPVVHHKVAEAQTAKAPVSKQSYNFLSAVGRRKEAIARVRLFAKGTGKIIVNGEEFTKYFPGFDLQYVVLQPLKLLGLESALDFTVKVQGGGKFGQADAVRHGLARTLLLLDPEHRKALRTAGYLTRDARVKERKKYGLKKARRGPQFSKR